MAGHQVGLNKGYKTNRGLLLKEGMHKLIFLSILVGHQDFLSPIFSHRYRAGHGDFEVAGHKLTTIDQRKREAVCEHGTKFLHKVERKTRASRALAMEETYRGVKANRLQR